MPIIVAGMHRSGTSMLARMLNLCGLYLGKTEDLHQAQPDNPEGFWEHIGFHSINERILGAFGGSWDFPPDFPTGFESDIRLDPIRDDARRLINDFREHQVWGFKDPRTSLTLPFWKQLVPDLKIILAVRNPQDVANSLHNRGYSSDFFAFDLWTQYWLALLPRFEASDTIFTEYSSYFADAEAELQRICEFASLTPTPVQLEEACATIKPNLKHSSVQLQDLFFSCAPPETVALYCKACEASGPVAMKSYSRQLELLAAVKKEADFLLKELRVRELVSGPLEDLKPSRAIADSEELEKLRRQSQLLLRLLSDAQTVARQSEDLQTQLENATSKLGHQQILFEEELERQQKHSRALEEALAAETVRAQAAEAEVRAIKNSKIWRYTRWYAQMRPQRP